MSESMHQTLERWLEELEQETNVRNSSEICKEAISNMVAFGISEDLLTDWGGESVTSFLKSCSELYERKSQGFDMVFYSWFDEQASQIRISAMSRIHEKLPFRCE